MISGFAADILADHLVEILLHHDRGVAVGGRAAVSSGIAAGLLRTADSGSQEEDRRDRQGQTTE